MKLSLTNKRVVAVLDDRSDPKYPSVTIAIDEDLGGNFPNHLAFRFTKELERRAEIRVGDYVEITGYVGSRQSKGRYFTNIRGDVLQAADRDEGCAETAPCERSAATRRRHSVYALR